MILVQRPVSSSKSRVACTLDLPDLEENVIMAVKPLAEAVSIFHMLPATSRRWRKFGFRQGSPCRPCSVLDECSHALEHNGVSVRTWAVQKALCDDVLTVFRIGCKHGHPEGLSLTACTSILI